MILAASACGEITVAPDTAGLPTTAPYVSTTSTTTTTTIPPLTYRIQAGDTLSAIAGQFEVTTDQIMEANDLSDARNLQIGQRLIIPRFIPTTTTTTGSAGDA